MAERSKRLVRLALAAAPSLASIATALALGFVAVALARQSLPVAWKAYAAMLWGGFGDLPRLLDGADVGVLLRPWGETTTKAALLCLTGLSVALAFRVGYFNIGAQGQMLVGALATAVLGAKLELPSLLHPAACLLGGALAGALLGLVPAALKLERGVHEVITTIMLNWIAASLVEGWLVVGPLRASGTGEHSVSGTDDIHLSAQLPRLLGDSSRLHLGFVLAVALVAALAWWLSRTRLGFEVRAVGLGVEAARSSGIPVARRIYLAMALSGALSGIAGAVLVLGTEHKLAVPFAAPYGFDGIAMALIGQNHPVGVGLSALLFGALRAGGTRMQLFGVHKSFPELIQGLALLLVAGRLAWLHLLQRRRRPAADRSTEPGAPR